VERSERVVIKVPPGSEEIDTAVKVTSAVVVVIAVSTMTLGCNRVVV